MGLKGRLNVSAFHRGDDFQANDPLENQDKRMKRTSIMLLLAALSFPALADTFWNVNKPEHPPLPFLPPQASQAAELVVGTWVYDDSPEALAAGKLIVPLVYTNIAPPPPPGGSGTATNAPDTNAWMGTFIYGIQCPGGANHSLNTDPVLWAIRSTNDHWNAFTTKPWWEGFQRVHQGDKVQVIWHRECTNHATPWACFFIVDRGTNSTGCWTNVMAATMTDYRNQATWIIPSSAGISNSSYYQPMAATCLAYYGTTNLPVWNTNAAGAVTMTNSPIPSTNIPPFIITSVTNGCIGSFVLTLSPNTSTNAPYPGTNDTTYPGPVIISDPAPGAGPGPHTGGPAPQTWPIPCPYPGADPGHIEFPPANMPFPPGPNGPIFGPSGVWPYGGGTISYYVHMIVTGIPGTYTVEVNNGSGWSTNATSRKLFQVPLTNWYYSANSGLCVQSNKLQYCPVITNVVIGNEGTNSFWMVSTNVSLGTSNNPAMLFWRMKRLQ
jgi:hypothetical protein